MAIMHNMKLLLMLGYILGIQGVSGETDLALTDCANPQPNDCSFYKQCLEPQYNCGQSGYPLAEGYKYCSKSLAVRDRMSTKGQQWVTDTMLCLQRQMVPFTLERRQISCEELEHDALDIHPKCYVDKGWCALPISDWEVIVEVVFPTFFSNPQTIKEALLTGKDCLLLYVWLAGKHFLERS